MHESGDGGGGGGGGDGDGDSVGKVTHVNEVLTMRDELRMLRKAVRERAIRDELQRLQRLQRLAELRDEIAGLDREIGFLEEDLPDYYRGAHLSDAASQELSYRLGYIALTKARVNELGLQMSEIKRIVRVQEQRAEKVALQAEVDRGSAACAKKGALRAEVPRRSAADGLAALNVPAAAPSKGQCPDDEMTRSDFALTTSSTSVGGDTCEGVKVREESDGAGEQQQPQRQQQPQQPRPQQQQQEQVGPLSACDNRPQQQQRDQVGPLSACDHRPEQQQRQQQQSQEGQPGNHEPVEEEVDGVDGVEEGGGLVMEEQHGGTSIRMDAGGRWCWGGKGFPPFAPD